jgi:hypothetical protein
LLQRLGPYAEAAAPGPPAKASARPAWRAVTGATAAAREDRMAAQPAPKAPLLGLLQDETWQGDYDDVPVHGNAPGLPTPCRVV